MPEDSSGPDEGGNDWLDWERALAVVDDDVALLEHLVDVFIRQFAPAIAELRTHALHGDWGGIARRAHQLAGAAGAIGAQPLELLARSVDRAARAASANIAPCSRRWPASS